MSQLRKRDGYYYLMAKKEFKDNLKKGDTKMNSFSLAFKKVFKLVREDDKEIIIRLNRAVRLNRKRTKQYLKADKGEQNG
ncbi:unnamed protein product [marine sediment metagenome]|uniref:Uncharacterized protein n=1 Tax=marine sediment metagenome TaxID=412755 RepID=X1AF66_9ZZZZ